jgi:hypothetical protein
MTNRLDLEVEPKRFAPPLVRYSRAFTLFVVCRIPRWTAGLEAAFLEDMRKGTIIAAAAGCLGMALPALVSRPAPAASYGDVAPAERAATGVELIVFEAPGCRYCPVFRRDVAPSYAGTPAGRAAPLRFVDLNDPVADRFRLASPVTMVPTVVLVRDGVEIGRIAGYVGRESMHRLLATMLPSE